MTYAEAHALAGMPAPLPEMDNATFARLYRMARTPWVEPGTLSPGGISSLGFPSEMIPYGFYLVSESGDVETLGNDQGSETLTAAYLATVWDRETREPALLLRAYPGMMASPEPREADRLDYGELRWMLVTYGAGKDMVLGPVRGQEGMERLADACLELGLTGAWGGFQVAAWDEVADHLKTLPAGTDPNPYRQAMAAAERLGLSKGHG